MNRIEERICINCPAGCHLTITRQDDGSFEVTGNTCPRGRAYGISEVTDPRRVVTASVTNVNAILIRNHGPVSFGRTLTEAKVCAQIVEKSCRIYLTLLASGGMQTISEPYVSAGRDYFLNGYGKT